MAGRLTARFAATVTKPGRHGDGNGLYLLVKPSGAISDWAAIHWSHWPKPARRLSTTASWLVPAATRWHTGGDEIFRPLRKRHER